MKRSIATTFCLLSLAASAAEPSQPNGPNRPSFKGIPFYQIYEEKDIGDASRGNFIATAPDGRLFFGNENGIHSFDGSAWKPVLKTVSTRSKIRSLHWKDGIVYAAGYATIGTLSFDQADGVRYQPINDAPLSTEASEFYGRILEHGNQLYFVGSRSVVRYQIETEKYETFPVDSWLIEALVIDGRLHVSTDRNGLMRLDEGTFTPVVDYASFVEQRTITHLRKSPRGELAFSTENDEIYRIEPGAPLESFRRLAYAPPGSITDLAFIDEDRLAVSIAGRGLFVVNRAGAVELSLENTLDYRWSSVASLHADRQGTLWAMFNSTVGKVLVNNPLTLVDERLRPNVVYPLAHYREGKLYVTNQANLYHSQHLDDGRLSGLADALPDFEKSVSAAFPAADGLYVHAETSTYLYSDQELRFLGENGRLDRLVAFKSDPRLLLALSSNEVKVLRRDGDTLSIVGRTPHSLGSINKIARAPNDVFWLEVGLGTLGKVWLEDGSPQFRAYGKESGLPDDWIAIWEHGDQVLFTERSGVYAFDETAGRFRKRDTFEEFFPSEDGPIHRIVTDPQGNIWASYNSSNYILWKQPDGTYAKDHRSLSQLGELYLNDIAFLPNGDAILLTANEMFHLDAARVRPPSDARPSKPHLLRLSNIEGTETYFADAGFGNPPHGFALEPHQRNLAFRVSNHFSATLKQPSFQHRLEGLSNDWSKWSASNEFALTNLTPGRYTLRVRSRSGSAGGARELAIPFTVAPAAWETPIAYALYFAAAIGLLQLGYRLFARKLRATNETLERLVAERTREIEAKNSELELKATDLAKALDDLQNAQDRLIETSRKAGMAEVATNVLHNVGNVLNSINVSARCLSETLDQQRAQKLVRVSQLVNEHLDDLAGFLSENPKGKMIPQYLDQLSRVMEADFEQFQLEVNSMHDNIDHVKRIIATQQSHARSAGLFQPVNLPGLIDSALDMIIGDLESSLFEISRDFDPDLSIVSDKHRILQMVANFIKNAKEAIHEANIPLGLITISARYAQDRSFVRIQISDNGIGARPEDLRKVFTHGFTTKQNGHGFGMHSCANSAKQLGGSLQIESDGPGKGARVTLCLPVRPPNREPSREEPNASLNHDMKSVLERADAGGAR